MQTGLLMQWRRSVARRGVAAAALLALPVGVAAAIGIGGGLGGLGAGFNTFPQGESEQAGSQARNDLTNALVALASANGLGPGGPARGTGPGTEPGGTTDGQVDLGSGTGPATPTGPTPPAGPSPAAEPPPQVPVNPPALPDTGVQLPPLQGAPDVVDSLEGTINQLLGGG